MTLLRLVAPAKLGIRGEDAYGSGAFGASRRAPSGGSEMVAAERYQHRGVDFIVEPGQEILAPCDGEIVFLGFAYLADTRFRSIHIRPDVEPEADVKILYAALLPTSETRVRAGQPFAVAQDLRERYPGITPHVHLEVRIKGALVDPMTIMSVEA